LEERDKIYNADLTGWPVRLINHRDKFVFQCLVGCRYGDLKSFTKDNIVNGFLEYIPQKTKSKGYGGVVRVPLNEKARTILGRQNPRGNELFTYHCRQEYNNDIRLLLQLLGINRVVTIINRHTHQEEQHPMYELASSHLARRTFIGNLYKQVQDPNLIGALSGHAPNSKAFERYRTIDEDMKRELINKIN
jgi:integrase